MKVSLVPIDGGNPIELRKELTVVGRKGICDLHIDHNTVSKLHCVILKTQDMVLVRDLGSTNGIRLNGQRVRRAALLPNDLLAIAGAKFRVVFSAGEAPPDEGSSASAEPPREMTEVVDVDALRARQADSRLL